MRVSLSFIHTRTLPLSDIWTGPIQEMSIISPHDNNCTIQVIIHHMLEEVYDTQIKIEKGTYPIPINEIKRWSTLSITVIDNVRQSHEQPYEVVLDIQKLN